MDKEQRLRRLRAIVAARKIIAAKDKRYIVEIPGYNLRGSIRSQTPHEAINQMVQKWSKSGELNIASVGDFKTTDPSQPLRVKLTDFESRKTVELSVPIEQALIGSTSYLIPDFGGYTSESANLGPNVEEYEERDIFPVSEKEIGEREAVMEDVSTMELVEPNFSVPKILTADPSLNFAAEDINELIFRSKNKEWITIPSQARKKGIPNLYILGDSPTSHEKYFGIKTEYGYLPTIASSVLLFLALAGKANRGDLSQVQKLKVPDDFKFTNKMPGSDFILTLPPYIEEAAIRDSYFIMRDAEFTPGFLTRLSYNAGTDNFTFGHTKAQGGRKEDKQTPANAPVSKDMQDRLAVLNRGLSKPIENYRVLNSLVKDFVINLDAKIVLLLKEQHAVNASARFLKPSGKQTDVDDVLRNIILRKIIAAIQGAESFRVGDEDLKSPLESAEFEEGEYLSPS